MKDILLIEEDTTLVENLTEEFKANNINVFCCYDRVSAEQYIFHGHQFDIVILDWFFENPEDSLVSRLIMNMLYKTHFRPIFIYTNNKSDFDESPKEDINFPLNLVSCISKGDGLVELKKGIKELLESNISLRIADTYRKSLNSTLEKMFFELNEVKNVNLEKILSKIYGSGENIDWSNDFILNLLHRALISDRKFIGNITDLLMKITPNKPAPNSLESKKIANKILYFQSNSDLIRNGDIISIKYENGIIVIYGIVVTPDCDLEHNKTRYIELIELVPLTEKKLNLTTGRIENIKSFNDDSFYFFPSVRINDTDLIDFVAVLKSKIIINEALSDDSLKYPCATQRLLFSTTYLHNEKPVKIELICSKSNPYKAEFLQKLHTNNSRVGIPDIKDLFG